MTSETGRSEVQQAALQAKAVEESRAADATRKQPRKRQGTTCTSSIDTPAVQSKKQKTHLNKENQEEKQQKQQEIERKKEDNLRKNAAHLHAISTFREQLQPNTDNTLYQSHARQQISHLESSPNQQVSYQNAMWPNVGNLMPLESTYNETQMTPSLHRQLPYPFDQEVARRTLHLPPRTVPSVSSESWASHYSSPSFGKMRMHQTRD
ncbi:uncharacterized protein LOC110454159 [Mizuhopecten yessoensis]|uniref:uncharacterized protein LOC110454159 n=1 Tax=Mizuhopecten yessoensis TaxID=6573 RepID=UPI000B45913D|nr:uncharacterized protein LOC110454159 [Mizuhopecten yessoensis]